MSLVSDGRAACIDIGSNTTRLLIADRQEGRLSEVHQEREFTRLGAGRDPGGRIAAARITAAAEVAQRQVQIAREHGARQIRVIATAAVRDAPNGAVLVAAVHERTGLEVEVLSAEAEARLAFLGAALMQDAAVDGRLAVIDVGGGSSELVVGAAPARVEWWRSVPIGSGTVTERWLTSDPPAPGELGAAAAALTDALAALEPPRPSQALAVGGSATSLCRVAGPALDGGALERALAALTAAPAAAVAERFDIDPRRARLLPAGLLILQAVQRRLGIGLVIGRGGIREGVLLEAPQL